MWKEIYYKELARVIMETKTFRVFRACPLESLRPRKSQCFSLRPKAGKGQNPGLKEIRQKECSLSKGGSDFLFCSDLQLIGRGPPPLWKVVHSAQSTHQNVNLIQKHHRSNT